MVCLRLRGVSCVPFVGRVLVVGALLVGVLPAQAQQVTIEECGGWADAGRTLTKMRLEERLPREQAVRRVRDGSGLGTVDEQTALTILRATYEQPEAQLVDWSTRLLESCLEMTK